MVLIKVYRIRLITDHTLVKIAITAKISPDVSRTESEQTVLKRFRGTSGPHNFDRLVKLASDAMGFNDSSSMNQPRFAGDVLCVEIRGPRCPRLTLVDLPGLIPVNPGKAVQGNADDIRIVESITDKYIRDEMSVILPVVNSNVDFQDHGILEKARRVDPEGRRTFGVITKPDRIDAGGKSEADWFKLARQSDDAFFKFGKGCHVLVNRSNQKTQAGTSSAERDANEENFFRDEVWSEDSGENAGKTNNWHALYQTDQWGVRNLVPRLGTLLYKHTLDQIDSVRTDIETRLANYDAQLEHLGLGLLDPSKLASILSKRFLEISKTTSQAVLGTYRLDPSFFGIGEDEKSSRYLRSRIRDGNAAFDAQMKAKGHRSEYKVAPDEEPPDNFAWADFFHRFLKETVGTELPGNFDPERTTKLFHHYSKPWVELSREYLKLANRHCRDFLLLVVNRKLGKDFPDIATNF
ncbi:hypothetical protein BU16DRAFT_148804 [Lophium mytilinum]|uniref:Dynamin GTPase domain-containing protein n=1 Tax=Lophium mytilinum TaxID=390894 RepID=A0A6A6QD47_9PEZI|nr:hypothetical protein BU16DRAFT_148804 [Lophium mytilinum]